MSSMQETVSTFLSQSKIELSRATDGREFHATSSFYYASLSFELNSTIDATQNARRTSRAVLKAGEDLIFDKISSTNGNVAKIHTTYGNAAAGVRESFYLVERATDAIFVTGTIDGRRLVPLRLDGPIVIQPCSLDIQLFTFTTTSEVESVKYRFNVSERSEFSGLEKVIDAKTMEFRASRLALDNHGVTEAECYKCWKEFYCCLEGGKSEGYCDTMLGVCNIFCGVVIQ